MPAKKKTIARKTVAPDTNWVDPSALKTFASDIIKDLLRTDMTPLYRNSVAENAAEFAQSIVARVSL